MGSFDEVEDIALLLMLYMPWYVPNEFISKMVPQLKRTTNNDVLLSTVQVVINERYF